MNIPTALSKKPGRCARPGPGKTRKEYLNTVRASGSERTLGDLVFGGFVAVGGRQRSRDKRRGPGNIRNQSRSGCQKEGERVTRKRKSEEGIRRFTAVQFSGRKRRADWEISD